MARLIDRQTLTRGLKAEIDAFEDMTARSARRAARVATQSSQQRWRSKLSKRATTGPRPRRPTTQGTFANFISWQPVADGQRVSAQVGKLAKVAPYWLIQEIGTGKSAKVAVGGKGRLRGGQGRDGPREQGNVSVKPQAGRPIPSGLVWGGNNPKTDQIIPGPRRKPIVIKEEIKGKHYLRTGGNAGFAVFHQDLGNDFRSAFGGHPKR